MTYKIESNYVYSIGARAVDKTGGGIEGLFRVRGEETPQRARIDKLMVPFTTQDSSFTIDRNGLFLYGKVESYRSLRSDSKTAPGSPLPLSEVKLRRSEILLVEYLLVALEKVAYDGIIKKLVKARALAREDKPDRIRNEATDYTKFVAISRGFPEELIEKAVATGEIYWTPALNKIRRDPRGDATLEPPRVFRG